MGFIFE